MRVVHVIKVTSVAGAERHVLTLLGGLCERDVETRLIILVEPSNLMPEMVEAAEARHIPIERIVIKRDIDFTVYRQLRSRFRALKPDIVHAHLIHAEVYAVPAARLARVPAVVVTRHNEDPFRRSRFFKPINAVIRRLTHRVIAISEAMTHFCEDVESIKPDKIEMIHYGLEAGAPDFNTRQQLRAEERKALSLDEAHVVVGTVSRLTEQKGIIYALHAFARVAEQFPQVRMVIAGDGPLRKKLESEAQKLAVADRVIFTGWYDDPYRILAVLDILMMPSLWEGFGLVLLEAMSQALPIVASHVGAIPEVVLNGETGYLTAPGDVDAMQKVLEVLIKDRALRQHLGLMGQDRQETYFTAEVMVEKTLAFYRSL
ncbi:MAG: glycosyltransferase [Chloroflexi bacterium]|nr:MAG: glycosyltransferase [Chloroflexota bacterium]